MYRYQVIIIERYIIILSCLTREGKDERTLYTPTFILPPQGGGDDKRSIIISEGGNKTIVSFP
jgi:hypothetical protein